ncbi:MFS transporter [Paenarthrobacter sp. NPDC090520]|uniref:MFS transporter n=1 Tax=Paenarthrobacter sp. NPDC090520 TaxID=3364382 RepID=UPI0038042531
MTDQLTRSPSALRVVLTTPLYRGAMLALFFSGLGFSAAAPQIARFLVEDLGSSLTVAGLYYLTNLAALVAGYLVGRRSDHTGRRLGPFRLCAVAGFLGWLGIAFSTELWMPFAISALVLGFAGAATSQLFAAIHDELQANPSPAGDGVISYVRMSLTLGWVIGPVAGSFLGAQLGLRAMLMATAACTLAQLLPLGTLRDRARNTDTTVAPKPKTHMPLTTMWPLLAFTGLYILVYAGEPIKYAYLPIYMNDHQYPPTLGGIIIGIQPLVELILMPVAAVLARRTGMLNLMVLGALFGVGANVLFALSGSPVGLLIAQVLMGGVWGIFAGLGIIVAQRLLPQAVATASAIFISAPAVSSALGGLVGGLGVGVVGLPLVFLAPGALALTAAGGLYALQLRLGRRI